MKTSHYQNISKVRRDYNSLVANETLEDYALRFAPRSFRKWSGFIVGNTAFGSTSFLVLEAIGGFLSINYGFTNACWAILIVGLIIFITSFPITYYAAKYHIDIDLLTRSAGFGYIGSTLTSLIYASFTFTLFALEASIMSLALELYWNIPLAYAHIISAVLVIPLVTFGITTINQMQLWTQPIWLMLLVAPYFAVLSREPDALLTLEAYLSIFGNSEQFNWLMFGTASTIAFSMVAQIGEQVDFLRFMPDIDPRRPWRWWLPLLISGPGWIFFGMLRQFAGALLAHLAIRHGISPTHAHEPTQMYTVAYSMLFENPKVAIAVSTLFVVLSQLKINVTNAYAGSLAWSNFFSRITHSHPGRVVWLFFNVMIALLLMEFGVFGALEKVLGLFSNISIAWISSVAADLMINKPLGLSPKQIEFKRAYLADLNPVGIFATFWASTLSILAYLGLFGAYPQAFSAFIALGLSFILVPLIALITKSRHYIIREHHTQHEQHSQNCSICENHFESEDMAFCPAYSGPICSLCCTLDARCQDACKKGYRFDDYLLFVSTLFFPKSISHRAKTRILRFLMLFSFLAVLTGIFISIIYYQDLLATKNNHGSFDLIFNNFLKIYASLLVFLGLGTWWIILNEESRKVALEETHKQTQLLLEEIAEHQKTDSKLQDAIRMAEAANQAKSRFLSNMSHEIRSPLNSIVGYAHILNQDPKIPAHRKQAVETLKRSSEHLSDLIEDILDIAKIEARKFDLKYQTIDFSSLIRHLEHSFSVQAESKGLLFNCIVVNRLPRWVRGDEKRVGQILINLLSNAIKFTPNGSVSLKIAYSAGVATFQIIDTGVGIAPDQLQQIFQPFTRLTSANAGNAVGSGLGLTISKTLTEVMGGEITVDSKLAQGTTFSVKLLLPSVHVSASEKRDDTIIGYQGSRRKILLVDDQKSQRQLLIDILEPLGFIICEASSGENCLFKIMRERPDLIIMDISMPGLNGIDTTSQLRKLEISSPILIVSANAYADDRVAAINAGCNDFLPKPINPTDLLDRIGTWLNLDWIYIQPQFESVIPDAQSDIAIPPEDLLESCEIFARIGDMLGLKSHVLNLMTSHPEYDGFFQTILEMIKAFKVTEIRQILATANRNA